jgi:large repetitive protein
MGEWLPGYGRATDSVAKLADDAVYNVDVAATSGSLSYASPVLTWTGDLAPGASAVITYPVTVNNPDTGNQLLPAVTQATPGSNCPAGGTDARCSVTVTVVGASTLTFTQTAAAASAVAGGMVSYTLTIANRCQPVHGGRASPTRWAGAGRRDVRRRRGGQLGHGQLRR